jgi:hypothetical protein
MAKRKPTDPIPGFEDEFTGTVGHEKRIHQTHFTVPTLPWKLPKKRVNTAEAEVTDGKDKKRGK